jgi:hypothetical protein
VQDCAALSKKLAEYQASGKAKPSDLVIRQRMVDDACRGLNDDCHIENRITIEKVMQEGVIMKDKKHAQIGEEISDIQKIRTDLLADAYTGSLVAAGATALKYGDAIGILILDIGDLIGVGVAATTTAKKAWEAAAKGLEYDRITWEGVKGNLVEAVTDLVLTLSSRVSITSRFLKAQYDAAKSSAEIYNLHKDIKKLYTRT